MGYLHEGHLSLVRRARSLGDVVVVSIFVNPTQFGQNEDLDRYPRDPARDRRLCRAEGVDILFQPQAADVYADDHSTWVVEKTLASGLCGASRPWHFPGVTTVVAMLFNLVQPDTAVFGAKDYQQALVIRRMVRDLHFPVRVVVAPTFREEDGLAMSSRNRYLSPSHRREAAALNEILAEAVERLADGERSAARLRSWIRRQIRRRAPSGEIDYVDVVDANGLDAVGQVRGPVRLAIAVRFEGARLIDNMGWTPPTRRSARRRDAVGSR
jgi:pantoate--beta-alanine ligase